jgi:DNA-binding NtrC family response regulator
MPKYEILFIDDDPLILTANKALLEERGFGVTTRNDSRAALELLDNQSFDIVITDLVMKDFDGISILEKAKKKNKEIMVIILTGYGNLKSAIEALRLDADDYLLKPCEVEEFVFRINRCIEKLELLRKIKLYEKILPVCTYCKKIRDDTNKVHGQGKWISMEEFIKSRTKIDISHSLCPACVAKINQELGDL